MVKNNNGIVNIGNNVNYKNVKLENKQQDKTTSCFSFLFGLIKILVKKLFNME